MLTVVMGLRGRRPVGGGEALVMLESEFDFAFSETAIDKPWDG